MIDYLIPMLLLLSSAFALRKKESSYDLLLAGAAEGLRLLLTLIPALIFPKLCLLRAISRPSAISTTVGDV